jgi:hypothetical protein
MSDTPALRLALPALFERAQSLPDHEPEWLTKFMRSDWGQQVAAIWSGRANAVYCNDDSAIDMALAVELIDNGATVQMAAEAIMCRRLRVGRKVEKVNPAVRTDYLTRTIEKVRDELEWR